MSEWKEKKLSKIAFINPKESLSKGEKAKKVGMGELQPFTKKISGYSIEEYKGGSKFRNGDTLVARITPSLENGKTAFVDFLDDGELGFGSTEFIVLRKKEGISNKEFLYYLARSPEFREIAILSMTGSSGRQRVQTDVIEKHNFPTPSLDEQRIIASVLSSLDDKIDLLHRQNQTLEAMVETLFRRWFIEEKEEDWKEKPLSKIAKFLNGKACQKYPPKNEVDKLPVLKIKELRNGVTENSDWASTEIDDEYIVENGDVIFSWSASLLVRIWNGQRCILNQHLFKVTSQDFPKWFYFSWCKYHLERFIAIAKAHATTMGHIRRKDLDKAMVTIPPGEILEEMTEKMSPLLDKIISNNQQITSLEKLLDTLLPKLMSGEVRVALGEGQKQAVTIQSNGKKKRNIQFEEAILISAIIKAFYAPKIGNVSRQWYQKISYLHKRKLKDSQANVFELTEEYGKKAAGPYKKEMRYQGPEGIAISNGYIEPVNRQAFRPADKIEDIDKYFYEWDYWNWKVFEDWTVSTLKFVRVKKLGVWATVDYCLIELKEMGEDLTADNIIAYLSKSEEWNHKLNQSEFSPENIELAMEELFEMYKY